MTRTVVGRMLCWTMLASLAVVFMAADSSVLAQQGPVKKAMTKRWHRLPANTAKITTEAQKAAIYKIQEEYGPKIAALESQLEALKAERKAKINAILTAEQQKQVEDAKKKTKPTPAKDAGKALEKTPTADQEPEKPSF